MNLIEKSKQYFKISSILEKNSKKKTSETIEKETTSKLIFKRSISSIGSYNNLDVRKIIYKVRSVENKIFRNSLNNFYNKNNIGDNSSIFIKEKDIIYKNY